MSEETFKVVGASKEALIAKAGELGVTIPKDTTYNELKSLVANAINAAEATEDSSSEQQTQPTPEKSKAKTFEVNGRKYAFSKHAPKAFRYGGVTRTQKEWIEDSDAIADMIESRCVFIEPKN